MNERNEELQQLLNCTHAMLVENNELVENLSENVMARAKQGQLHSKVINFMKDEGKAQAQHNFSKLFSQ